MKSNGSDKHAAPQRSPLRGGASQEDPFRFWHMRFWHGMSLTGWLKMLRRYQWAISLRKLPLAASISIMAVVNSALRLFQELVFFFLIRRTKIIHPPIFIVGHWRSGTTLLHELLIGDTRFTYANTYQCMAPNHFLLTSWIATRLTFLLPRKRPMDNMVVGWKQPQEDEFALANLGQVSPYQNVAFPRTPSEDSALTLEGLPREQIGNWKKAVLWFFRRISVQSNKPIVIKSPTHTARIKTLLELFPEAKFVFVVRNPEHVFGSTLKLWRALRRSQSLQTSDNSDLEEKVLHDFEIMLTAWQRDRNLIPQGHLYETRYEDFVKNPVGEMERLYGELDLNGFESQRPRVVQYFADRADYKVDQYALKPEQTAQIQQRWGKLMARYGYKSEAAETSEAKPEANSSGMAR